MLDSPHFARSSQGVHFEGVSWPESAISRGLVERVGSVVRVGVGTYLRAAFLEQNCERVSSPD